MNGAVSVLIVSPYANADNDPSIPAQTPSEPRKGGPMPARGKAMRASASGAAAPGATLTAIGRGERAILVQTVAEVDFGPGLVSASPGRRPEYARYAPVTGWQGMEATRMTLAAMQSIDQGGQMIRMADLPDGPALAAPAAPS